MTLLLGYCLQNKTHTSRSEGFYGIDDVDVDSKTKDRVARRLGPRLVGFRRDVWEGGGGDG